jgi:hypothetical protein
MLWYIDGSVSMGNLDVYAVDEKLGNYRVCMIDCEDDDEALGESGHEANARLIAAAPDMLAALENAAAQLRTLLDDSIEDDYSALTSAEIAIAKAKGEA